MRARQERRVRSARRARRKRNEVVVVKAAASHLQRCEPRAPAPRSRRLARSRRAVGASHTGARSRRPGRSRRAVGASRARAAQLAPRVLAPRSRRLARTRRAVGASRARSRARAAQSPIARTSANILRLRQSGVDPGAAAARARTRAGARPCSRSRSCSGAAAVHRGLSATTLVHDARSRASSRSTPARRQALTPPPSALSISSPVSRLSARGARRRSLRSFSSLF